MTADDGQDRSAIAGSDGAGVRCRLLVPDEFAEAVELVTVAVAELSFYRWLFGDAMSDEALRWAAERKCGCVRQGGSIGHSTPTADWWDCWCSIIPDSRRRPRLTISCRS